MSSTGWKVVDTKGRLMNYRGKDLIFEEDEKERAESIVWFLDREAKGGPFKVVRNEAP